MKKFWLKGYTFYSTNEPCPMCFSAIHWARMKKVVYGQPVSFAKKYGFNEDVSSSRKITKVEIKGGVLKDEVTKLFEKWKKGKHTMY